MGESDNAYYRNDVVNYYRDKRGIITNSIYKKPLKEIARSYCDEYWTPINETEEAAFVYHRPA